MVTGKGGVGKSVIAAALAQECATQGFKTLLVELGEISSYEYVFKDSIKKTIGYEPTPLDKNLYLALWSGETCLKEYVQYLVKIKALADLFFDNKVMRTFVKAAPALKELAVLGKITSGIRHWGPPLEFDRIVVDCFATGHFMALLKAPIGIAELISAGPMGEQSRAMQQVLSDPQYTNYFIVSLLEELPVSETFELQAELKKWIGQTAVVVANKHFDSNLTSEQLNALKAETQNNKLGEWFLDNIKVLEERSRTELTRLEKSGFKIIKVPLILSVHTADVIRKISEKVKFL
ncbi:MAG: ArsA-related P-loop ATPase [Bdellovibrionota bacterium]